jgi:hypothetical protein
VSKDVDAQRTSLGRDWGRGTLGLDASAFATAAICGDGVEFGDHDEGGCCCCCCLGIRVLDGRCWVLLADAAPLHLLVVLVVLAALLALAIGDAPPVNVR